MADKIDNSLGYHQQGGLQTVIDASKGGQNGPAMQLSLIHI